MTKYKPCLILLLLGLLSLSGYSQQYRNFKVSIYCRAYEVAKMGDTTNYLKPIWDEITRQLKVDKVYLETHRDLHIVDQKTLDIAKEVFQGPRHHRCRRHHVYHQRTQSFSNLLLQRSRTKKKSTGTVGVYCQKF